MKKLIEKAETLEEAIAIQQLGTMWKKTGFSYDVRLEKMTDDIYYFKKDEKLSFTQPEAKQTHKLIIGDNYKALINLQQEYQGKIKMIYIDPPYGKDSMGQFAQTNYKNNITRDNLLAMLEPRLRLARNLLSDDGVIFCSIDDKNQAYVKILFDEVFGEGNFVCNLIWKTKTAPKGVPTKNMLVSNHEYITVYQKTNNYRFQGKARNDEKFSNPDNDPRGLWKADNMKSTTSNNYFDIIDPKTGWKFTKNWAFSKTSIEQMIKENKIIFPNTPDGTPRQKKFLTEMTNDTIPLTSLIGAFQTETATNKMKEIFETDKMFGFPKPVDLIKFLVEQSTDKDSIILDFFAGSGTTGQAVLEQNKADGGNRQFILVQLDEPVEGIQKEFCEKNNLPLNLASITYERLKRVMTGKASDGSNFKWLEKNEKLGDNLLVCNVEHCANFDKNVFENIDETLYGLEKFEKPIDKINWVCDNFEGTQKVLINKDGKQENKQGFIEE